MVNSASIIPQEQPITGQQGTAVIAIEAINLLMQGMRPPFKVVPEVRLLPHPGLAADGQCLRWLQLCSLGGILGPGVGLTARWYTTPEGWSSSPA